MKQQNILSFSINPQFRMWQLSFKIRNNKDTDGYFMQLKHVAALDLLQQKSVPTDCVLIIAYYTNTTAMSHLKIILWQFPRKLRKRFLISVKKLR